MLLSNWGQVTFQDAMFIKLPGRAPMEPFYTLRFVSVIIDPNRSSSDVRRLDPYKAMTQAAGGSPFPIWLVVEPPI